MLCVLSGRDADDLFKAAREMALAVVAHRESDLGQGIACGDEVLGMTDANGIEIGVRRQSDLRAKGAE